jgi:hypothetical protein
VLVELLEVDELLVLDDDVLVEPDELFELEVVGPVEELLVVAPPLPPAPPLPVSSPQAATRSAATKPKLTCFVVIRVSSASDLIKHRAGAISAVSRGELGVRPLNGAVAVGAGDLSA